MITSRKHKESCGMKRKQQTAAMNFSAREISLKCDDFFRSRNLPIVGYREFRDRIIDSNKQEN